METCAAAVILIYKTEEEKINKEKERKKKISPESLFPASFGRKRAVRSHN
jgi:hypothetical protein